MTTPHSSTAAALTLERLSEAPYPILSELRGQGSVVWAPRLEMWLVTSYDDVVAVLRDPERFSNDSPASTIQATFGRQMLSVEGEEQRRYKQACLGPFTGKAAREVWRPRVETHCRSLLQKLDRAVADGEAVELMAGYAEPLALETMGLVVGLPAAALPRIRGWYESFARSLENFGGDPEIHTRGQEAAEAMRRCLVEQLEDVLAAGHPPTDGPTTLIDQLAFAQDPLERAATVANLLIVLFGGIETTESMIGNALWCLFTEPGILERVRGAEDRDAAVDALIEESLRFEPAVQTLTRHATVDAELGGQPIRAGDTVQCMVGGANRDPAVFEEPDRFDLDRENARRHLSFGLGHHFCLGAQLARAETRSALTTLLERWPGVSLDEAASSPPRGHEFRKPGRLGVRLGEGRP